MSNDYENVSSDLIWQIVNGQHSKLVKRKASGGVQFSRDPFNLVNKHSRKYEGFVNDKPIPSSAPTTMSTTLPFLDHLVLLLPYSSLTSPPNYLSQNFTLTPGGRHGDNKTENKLIALADGVYIEVIAFVDDDEEKMKGHWWSVEGPEGDGVGRKGWGWVDWALSMSGRSGDGEGAGGEGGRTEGLRHDGGGGEDDDCAGAKAFKPLLSSLQSQPNSNIPPDLIPQPLRTGSRLKPTNELIKWQVAFPPATARGRGPFWCFDVTPRGRRVPSGDEATKHKCGAIGVKALEIVLKGGADGEEGRGLVKLLEGYGMIVVEGVEGEGRSWEVGVPKGSGGQKSDCVISIVPPRGEADEAALDSGRNLVMHVVLWTEKESMDGKEIRGDINGDQVVIRLAYRRA